MNSHSNNNGHKPTDKKGSVHKEKTLLDIFRIINRRKFVLIISVIVAILLAIAYNYFSEPVYEASVLLKKETSPEKGFTSDFTDMLAIQTQDEIETEMELVETWTVLSKVVEELNLFVNVKSITEPDGTEHELETSIIEYSDSLFRYNPNNPFPYPQFLSVALTNKKESMSFIIKKSAEDRLEIYDAANNKFLGTAVEKPLVKRDPILDSIQVDTINFVPADFDEEVTAEEEPGDVKTFEIADAEIHVEWKDAPVGASVLFSIDSYYRALEKLKGKISIERKGKTNVFLVSVKSASPKAAMILANTVIDKFRDSRIQQQKETIRYSFDFVDDQLTEMQEKLREAEDNLSGYKSSGQIMTITESSRELIQFISKLEAEKLATDLQLDDYQNKIADLESELESSGYFDQSFLTPESSERNSPFSSLMTKLSDLELQRLELLQKRTENHPDVKSLDQQINLTKEKLGTFNENTLTAYQIIINSLEKKLLKISNLMSKYEVKMERLPAQENRLARLMRQKTVYEKIFTLLLDKREEMRMAELSKLQDIAIVDPAHEPTEAIAPREKLNLIIAILLGGFLGVLGIFVLELKDTKLVNLDELEDEFKVPVFAIIPNYSDEIQKRIEEASDPKDRLVTMMGEEFGFRETYRLLKTKLLFQMKHNEKTFLVTSCEENTGKTSIVANLAVSIAEENKKILIIDADLRKGELTKMFGVRKDTPGLIHYLSNDNPIPSVTKISRFIDLMPSGGTRENSSNLLTLSRMGVFINEIEKMDYDYIFIDTPPVTRVVDTLVLGKWVNDSLLIVRPGFSFKESVKGGIQDMQQAYIKIHGVIANAAKIEHSSYRYRYGYGYGYEYGEKGKSTIRKRMSSKKTNESKRESFTEV